MKFILSTLIVINLLACGFIYMTPKILYSVGEDQLGHIFENLKDNQGISIDEGRLDQMRGLENEYGLTGKKALHFQLLQTGRHVYGNTPGLALILILVNTTFLGILRFRKDKGVQQAGPGYPPQGVGSPEP
jgi:hypothetical protein